MNKKWWMLPVMLLAVAGLLMIGCPTETKEKPPAPGADLVKVDLGVGADAFNTWGGGKNKEDITKSTQAGWATDGFTWDDDAEVPKALNYVAEKKGYKLEDFQKAKYLVLEMDGSISGGLHLIWGGCVGEGEDIDEDATKALDGWNDASVTSDTGQAGASYGSTFEDGVLTIELAKAFQAKNYAGYVSEDATAVRLVLAYYSSNLSALELTAAYLLVSDDTPEIIEPEPVIPVDPSKFPQFTNATMLDPATFSTSNKGWSFGAGDGKAATLEEYFAATYFVIASIGCGNADGFGGVQFGTQGDGDSPHDWKMTVYKSGDWTSFSHDMEEDVVYFVFPLAEFENLAGLKTANATQAQFVINWGLSDVMAGDFVGYLTAADLSTKPDDAVDFAAGDPALVGYITKSVGLTKK